MILKLVKTIIGLCVAICMYSVYVYCICQNILSWPIGQGVKLHTVRFDCKKCISKFLTVVHSGIKTICLIIYYFVLYPSQTKDKSLMGENLKQDIYILQYYTKYLVGPLKTFIFKKDYLPN